MSGFQSQWLQSQQYWDDKLQKNQAQLGVVFFEVPHFKFLFKGDTFKQIACPRKKSSRSKRRLHKFFWACTKTRATKYQN